MTDRFFDLVAPLGQRSLFDAEPTAMRIPDTAAPVVWSGAVSQLGLFDARSSDVDSATGRSTRATTTMPGARTSATATRTTTTRTTSSAWFSSADHSSAGHADFSFPELVQAHDDCRRHKRNKSSTLAFEINLERNLWQLYEELQDGTYRPGQSICFVITRPRPREVWAAQFRDRIVHHLFYNRVAPRFHAGFIADSCACIPGRGTLYGVLRLDDPRRLHAAHQVIATWLPEQLGLQLNESKTILQPVERGVDFVGQVIKPWRRTLRRRSYHEALKRVTASAADALFATSNSYFGLLRQASHSHTDRARLGNLLLKRGRTVSGALTKTYRPSPTKGVAIP